MKKYELKATDKINYAIAKVTEKGSTNLFTRKYLSEIISKCRDTEYISNDELDMIEKKYNKVIEASKERILSLIIQTSSGESTVAYGNATWHHRSKDRLVLNIVEFTIKRISIEDEISVAESINFMMDNIDTVYIK